MTGEDELREAIRRNGAAHELMAALGRMGVFGKLEEDQVRWTAAWSTKLSAANLQAIERHAAGINEILIAAERDRRERTAP